MQPYEDKRAAYACDVTYGTNSEFGFDYLRDNMATSLEEKVQHGGRSTSGQAAHHAFAIVDEVDNILIDEARTPLIISGAPEQAADLYVQLRQAGAADGGGQEARGHGPAPEEGVRRRLRLRVRREAQDVAVTEQGVAKAEKFLGIDHLYRAENGHLVNHLHQSLKAESLYKRDVDYAVVDGEVKIIDEFTGRILEGRRWSEGLHQAVEAKEGVRVQEENQTLATITLQNYFRMYDKLAGMTGTALTEATEFMKIYKLPVVQIPTNRPMVRDDRNDQVYKTKDGKWTAVVREIEERHERRPAGARRHDLRRGLRAALRAAAQARASRTRCSTPSPSTPSARARSSPRPASPARSRSPPTWPAAASTSSSAATPSTSRAWSWPSSACARRPRLRRALRRDPARDRGARRGRPREGARRRRPVHRRHRAPRVAPHRQPAARPLRPPGRPGRVALLPLRRGRPRAPVRRRPHLPDPRPPRHAPTRRATRSRSRRRC